ncbi:MAG TPA: type II toxin-antitoxin system VapC family toxin [Thermoanaerobaculia bacterium]
MIAFDTNVLIRYLVQDDAAQAAQADQLLAEALAAGERCYIAETVLCELEWVLTSRYKARRTDVAAAIESLLLDPTFALSDPLVVRTALEAYVRGKADFSDYLIGARGAAEGVRITYSFDRALRNEDGFRVLT